MTSSSPMPRPNMARIIGNDCEARKLALRRPGAAPILRPLDASDFSDRVRAAATLGREAWPLPWQRAGRRPEGPLVGGGALRALISRGVRDRTIPSRTSNPLIHPEPPLRRRRRAVLRALV